jgi:hypothetical protein
MTALHRHQFSQRRYKPMASKETNGKPETSDLFCLLAQPFDPSEIKWRVTHTNRDGTRGAVIAFADPRAYTDRLNQLFTPSGWTRNYDVTTVSTVSRVKRDKVIQTGKVLVTCMLTIARLGTHSGSGEQWADEQNAMTAAEAQAFKRASSCFGLGRYLYNLSETWVSLDDYGKPIKLPALPAWALPKANMAAVKTNPACGPRPPVLQRGSIDQKITTTIESFRRILGDGIYGEILWRAGKARRANDIPNAQFQANVAEAMERASRGIQKANSLAEQVGEGSFIAVMDRLQIQSIANISTLESLRTLVAELEQEVARSVA